MQLMHALQPGLMENKCYQFCQLVYAGRCHNRVKSKQQLWFGDCQIYFGIRCMISTTTSNPQDASNVNTLLLMCEALPVAIYISTWRCILFFQKSCLNKLHCNKNMCGWKKKVTLNWIWFLTEIVYLFCRVWHLLASEHYCLHPSLWK